MAKKDMAYNHPAYIVREQLNGSINGSGGAARFAAFTTLRAKSLTLKPSTAGTSNDIGNAIVVDGTTTTTLATWTFGSGATTGTNVTLSTAATHGTWGTNGFLAVTKGTDATQVLQVAVEVEAVAGAQVEA